jgi:NADH-quinone oxidoreductase subunit E
MLTEEERAEIEKEIAHYPDRRSGCVEALKAIQKRYRWVSDGHLSDVAGFLGMSVHELDAVATFYPFVFRRPVGRHAIFVCDSVACWVMGYGSILETLRSELGVSFGETTGDGRFTLLPVSCLGECDHGPVMVIDEDIHRDVAPEGIAQILARYE